MAGDRILLVEDDAHIGNSLVRALEASGYDVVLARTGTEALSAFASAPADLVLLDLGLPDVDGLDVCRRIRASDPATIVIVVTARDEELDIVVGLDAGAVDYVTKPFTLAELLARVRAQLRQVDAGDARREGGTGLGLAIAREITVRSGGATLAGLARPGCGAMAITHGSSRFSTIVPVRPNTLALAAA